MTNSADTKNIVGKMISQLMRMLEFHIGLIFQTVIHFYGPIQHPCSFTSPLFQEVVRLTDV